MWDVIDRLGLGPKRPSNSPGRHVLPATNPNSCLGYRARIMQGWVEGEDTLSRRGDGEGAGVYRH
jgi:hypothetical protein